MKTTPESRRLLSAAEDAARAGGAVIRSGSPAIDADEKGAGDYVTEVDLAAERAIVQRLRGQTPDIPVVGEEGGGERGDRFWLVDPLDGTTNFLHGFPVVGVSIALIEHGEPTVGAVFNPYLDELYTAIRGSGAQLVRAGAAPLPLRVSERAPSQAVVATGFPFRDKQQIPRHLMAVRACLERFEDLRRPGAASLDLAWVAAGVFEGFFELGLSSWDVAAGALLVEEAGGVVSDWGGGDDYLAGDILAGSPGVHQGLLEIAEGPGPQTGAVPSSFGASSFGGAATPP